MTIPDGVSLRNSNDGPLGSRLAQPRQICPSDQAYSEKWTGDPGTTVPLQPTLTWPAWTAALVRMLTRMRNEPTHCMIISQEPNQRYVQLMIGHGQAHVEASSNTYLEGDFRLGPSEEQLLRRFGFEHPDAIDPRLLLPANWWFDADHHQHLRRQFALRCLLLGKA